MSKIQRGPYEEFLTNNFCHCCGNPTTDGVGVWKPRKFHWFEKRWEYYVPLCDDCWIYFKRLYIQEEIVGLLYGKPPKPLPKFSKKTKKMMRRKENEMGNKA
jgi:hypothetical protein